MSIDEMAGFANQQGSRKWRFEIFANCHIVISHLNINALSLDYLSAYPNHQLKFD
ncbi:hypothetical protein QUA83_27635 [Microcoleus sp. K1-B1]|uniref:hypothetical protein n=1 Tax=Microcoleus sp. K1-B6 TaxID=2818787 RepID=UPI002FD830BD